MRKIRHPELLLKADATLHLNKDSAQLVELALRHGEGVLSNDGALVVETGKHTGRAAKDKYIVKDPMTAEDVWWGPSNSPMSPHAFARLREDFFQHLASLDEVYVQD